MACLVLPVTILRSKCMGSRQGYRPLSDDEAENPVTVVVGKEKREFLVDPFVLQESPFRVLIVETMKKKNKSNDNDDDDKADDLHRRPARGGGTKDKAVFVDVDAILFEHMLWLMYNDCSSLFKLNVEEIIDFYAQDY